MSIENISTDENLADLLSKPKPLSLLIATIGSPLLLVFSIALRYQSEGRDGIWNDAFDSKAGLLSVTYGCGNEPAAVLHPSGSYRVLKTLQNRVDLSELDSTRISNDGANAGYRDMGALPSGLLSRPARSVTSKG